MSNTRYMGMDNLADPGFVAIDMNGLQIGRAADHLAGLAAGLFDQHLQGLADRTRVEIASAAGASSACSRASARPSRLPAPDCSIAAAGVPGRGEYLNEKAEAKSDLADECERRLEILFGLAGKADDEIARQRDIGTRGADRSTSADSRRPCAGGSSP